MCSASLLEMVEEVEVENRVLVNSSCKGMGYEEIRFEALCPDHGRSLLL